MWVEGWSDRYGSEHLHHKKETRTVPDRIAAILKVLRSKSRNER